jgi:hypothetical protein
MDTKLTENGEPLMCGHNQSVRSVHAFEALGILIRPFQQRMTDLVRRG